MAAFATVLEDLNSNEEALYATFEWSKHLVLKNTDSNYGGLLGVMTMLYMTSGQNKKRFIKSFVKKINEVKGMMEDEDDE